MHRVIRALADTASKALFREAEVTSVVTHGTHFRSIELTGEAMQGTTWHVGDKLQVRTDLAGFTTRTYTPITWDPGRGVTRLLAYAHGDGPGSTWARTATTGAPCQFVGPRLSLQLHDVDGPILFVGDETSFALVAAWHVRHPTNPPAAELYEVTDATEARLALDALRLSADGLLPRARDAHLDELSHTVVDLLRAHGDASLCLTGRAQTIAALRCSIKSSGAR